MGVEGDEEVPPLLSILIAGVVGDKEVLSKILYLVAGVVGGKEEGVEGD